MMKHGPGPCIFARSILMDNATHRSLMWPGNALGDALALAGMASC